MKKITALFIMLSLIFAFAACGDKAPATQSDGDRSTSTDAAAGNEYVPTTAPTAQGANLGISLDTGMKEKQDQLEYAAYYDIFYNQNAKEYADKKYTKDGVFAVLEDAFNGVTRYYVWGYADATKCCDFQWEFVMPKGADIPAPGSYVKITGTFTQSDGALDGYWFTDVEFGVENKFSPAAFDFDMTTLSPTLARVQIANMQSFADKFNGKTLRVFGRALSANTLQHPYYDNAWTMDFKCENTPEFSIGDDLLLTGKFTAQNSGSYVEGDSLIKL